MMTPDEARALVEGISQDDAFAVLHALRGKFGWSGTMFCPNDLADYIENCRQADDQEPLDPDALDEWVNDLMLSYEWNKGLTDTLTEHGFDLIGTAYEELKYQREGGASEPSVFGPLD